MAASAYSTLVEDEVLKDVANLTTKDKASLIDPAQPTRKENAPLRTQQSMPHETICGFDGLRVIIVSCAVVSLAITTAMVITILIGSPQVPPHGAVSTGNKVCSDAGVSILKKGGTAVDAAIAAMLCIGVVNPQSSGIGGGGFMLILDAESATYTGINFRESAPLNATLNMFAGNEHASIVGGLAIGVPGELHGMRQAWEKFGKLSWKDLFQPAIRFAQLGFDVTGSLEISLEGVPVQAMSKRFKKVFMPNGVKVKQGDKVYRPSYGRLLERIADNGIQAFYTGDIAREIANTVAEAGGILTLADLEGYKPRAMTPITTSYRDYSLVTLPQPSGGPMLITLMNVLELFNVTASDRGTSLYYQRFIEAQKFVKGQEIGLGDSAIANYSQQMVSKGNAKRIYSNISDDHTYPVDYYFNFGEGVLKTQGTSHLSVIDTDNNMVAVTTTVNTNFGSLVMTPSGVILNSEMGDFDWPGKNNASKLSKSNYIAPGKQPQSHMVPLMGRNTTTACARRFATGGEGGSFITSAVAQVVMELLAFRSSLANATDARTRVYPTLIPDRVEVEGGVSSAVIADLEAKGHEIVMHTGTDLANVQTVMKENDIIYAASDPRREGGKASKY